MSKSLKKRHLVLEISQTWDPADPVTKDQVRQVLRDYIISRIDGDYGGNVARFARATGLTRNNINDAKNNKRNTTIDHIAMISESIGPTMAEIFSRLAYLAAQQQVSTSTGSTIIRNKKTGKIIGTIMPESADQVRKFIEEDQKKAKEIAQRNLKQRESEPDEGRRPKSDGRRSPKDS